MARQSDPIVIPYEDDSLIHTDDAPFCSIDPHCPCHESPERIATVAEAVTRGELTHIEATQFAWRKQQHQCGPSQQGAAFWLNQAVLDLDEAVRELSRQAAIQQQRLQRLLVQVQEERLRWGEQAAALVPAAAPGGAAVRAKPVT